MSKKVLIKSWLDFGIIKNKKIISAFRKVPREKFVLKEYEKDAYNDIALPIKAGQTISQPTTIVIMLNALELKEGQKVLEIGSGSGYNAALLSEIVGKKGFVYTTEIIKELVKFAKENLKKYKNVQVLNVDGSRGYNKEKPYDGIIITAGCPKIPEVLVEQLKEKGVIVAPVGGRGVQKLIKCKKVRNKLICEDLGDFRFVPLKGKYGW